MPVRAVSFFSEGHRLDGDVYLPADLAAGERRPALITCSGYQGLKIIHPARFARALVPYGFVALAFDYRGFGASEGTRGRLVPQEQVEDVRAAVSYVSTLPEVEPNAVFLIGWALGGGVAIAAAADDERVRAVVALNAIGDGARSVRFQHDDASWSRLLERIASDRERRALSGRSELVHPFEIVRLDGVTGDYVDAELYKAPGFGSEVTLESADLLFRFRPADLVARLSPRPLLLIHGERNMLHSLEEAKDLYARAEEPRELVVLEGLGHTEWMYDDHPAFLEVTELVRRFLDTAWGQPAAAAAEDAPAYSGASSRYSTRS